MRESVFLLPMYTRLNIAEFCNTVITGVIFSSLYPSPEGVRFQLLNIPTFYLILSSANVLITYKI